MLEWVSNRKLLVVFSSVFCHPVVPKIVYPRSPGSGTCILLLVHRVVIQVAKASFLLFKCICGWDKISLSSLSVSLYRLIRILHLCFVGKQVKDEIQLWILRFIFGFAIHRVFDLGDNVVHRKLLGNVKIHGERSKSKCYLCFWWPSDSGKAYDVLSLLKEVEIKLSSRLSCTDWNEFCDMLKPVNYCTILYTCLSLGLSQGLLFHIDPVNLSFMWKLYCFLWGNSSYKHILWLHI